MGIYPSFYWRRHQTFISCPGSAVIPTLLFLAFIILAGCSGSGGGSDNQQNTQAEQDSLTLSPVTLFSTVSTITVNVAYEPDAEPFVGSIQNGLQYWEILENNIDALFLDRPLEPEVQVPKDLSGMTEIPDQGHASWTLEQIISLAKQAFSMHQTSTTADFFVLFLNGYYNSQGKINKDVIGLSIAGSPVIAVFKDVILESGYTFFTDTFIEQVTLVHEFGHSVGLVDNGIPMAANHEDPGHPHHCSNQECVMYWENDNTDIGAIILKITNSNSSIIFGPECLEDSRSYRP